MTEGVAHGVSLLAGRYQVGDRIGRGGMADVHVGTDARLGRRVAIKLLKPALATDPAFRSRFRREAQDAAKMAHPTIVRIFDAGEETVAADGKEVQLPFIVMEYVDGRLLKDIIAEGPLDPALAIKITQQVLTALEYSHRAGVIHRDIKPGNIMLTGSGQVKVMDFGIARAVSESSATIAETSTIMGTAQYFSPEQARGEAVDARTDLYSTGIVLFEMLTGQAPFTGDNPVAVAYQHVNQVPVPPSSLNRNVSPALDAVVLRAISKDRFERFQSASEFRAAVDAAAAGAIPPRRTAEPNDFNATLFGVNPTVTAGAEATMRQLTVDQTSRAVRTQNRPPVAWIWGGVVVMIAIVAAVLIWTVSLTQTDFAPSAGVKVPDVTNLPYADGEALLTNDQLISQKFEESSDTVQFGYIIRTDPPAGENVQRDQEIKVYVSTGAKQVAIPEVHLLTLEAATAALTNAGFTVGEQTAEHSPNVPANTVISTTPEAGTLVTVGKKIVLHVSDGLVEVPSVVGQSVADATTLLAGPTLQLEVATAADFSCSGGLVNSQSIIDAQPQKSKITVKYCAAP